MRLSNTASARFIHNDQVLLEVETESTQAFNSGDRVTIAAGEFEIDEIHHRLEPDAGSGEISRNTTVHLMPYNISEEVGAASGWSEGWAQPNLVQGSEESKQ